MGTRIAVEAIQRVRRRAHDAPRPPDASAVAFILWIVAHGLWHGLLDPTWTGREVLTVTLVLGWLGFRYYRRRRARLRRRLSPSGRPADGQ